MACAHPGIVLGGRLHHSAWTRWPSRKTFQGFDAGCSGRSLASRLSSCCPKESVRAPALPGCHHRCWRPVRVLAGEGTSGQATSGDGDSAAIPKAPKPRRSRNNEDFMVTPYTNMEEWERSRPRGFGEGKVYDTSLEEKLLQEIEKDRAAQAAARAARGPRGKETLNRSTKAVKGRKAGGGSAASGGARASTPSPASASAPDPRPLPPGAVPVRVLGLPKKLKVERDLRSAFANVRGLLDVRPVLSTRGGDKTRDPPCTGLAFVSFADGRSAARFVELFNGKGIKFGKLEKKISCTVVEGRGPEAVVPGKAAVPSQRIGRNQGEQLLDGEGVVGGRLQRRVVADRPWERVGGENRAGPKDDTGGFPMAAAALRIRRDVVITESGAEGGTVDGKDEVDRLASLAGAGRSGADSSASGESSMDGGPRGSLGAEDKVGGESGAAGEGGGEARVDEVDGVEWSDGDWAALEDEDDEVLEEEMMMEAMAEIGDDEENWEEEEDGEEGEWEEDVDDGGGAVATEKRETVVAEAGEMRTDGAERDPSKGREMVDREGRSLPMKREERSQKGEQMEVQGGKKGRKEEADVAISVSVMKVEGDELGGSGSAGVGSGESVPGDFVLPQAMTVEANKEAEMRIEALERRLLARAKAAALLEEQKEKSGGRSRGGKRGKGLGPALRS